LASFFSQNSSGYQASAAEMRARAASRALVMALPSSWNSDSLTWYFWICSSFSRLRSSRA
jgi:hypothetical protein